MFAIWRNLGVSITPNKNLVINIGIGNESTHTKTSNKVIRKVKLEQIKRIIHPKKILVDSDADKYTLENVFKANLKNFCKILLLNSYNFYKKYVDEKTVI